jgi:hypothetical protein
MGVTGKYNKDATGTWRTPRKKAKKTTDERE